MRLLATILLIISTQTLILQAEEKVIYKYKSNSYNVTIYNPKAEAKASALLFHGYSISGDKWKSDLDIINPLLNLQYRVIILDFKKTIYNEHSFAQTVEWKLKYPTRKWIREVVIDSLIKSEKIIKTDENILIGISTGARGVALLSIDDTAKIFNSIALISGDYNQSVLPKDRLMSSIYGSYSKYKTRWDTIDNIQKSSKVINAEHIFIAHGKEDPIVPFNQSSNLFKKYEKENKKIVKYFPQKQGHNNIFWKSALYIYLKELKSGSKE